MGLFLGASVLTLVHSVVYWSGKTLVGPLSECWASRGERRREERRQEEPKQSHRRRRTSRLSVGEMPPMSPLAGIGRSRGKDPSPANGDLSRTQDFPRTHQRPHSPH